MRTQKTVIASVAMAAFLLVVSGKAPAALIQPWTATGQWTGESRSVVVELVLVDSTGRLQTGLGRADFNLYAVTGYGIRRAGPFTFRVAEKNSVPGNYVLRITPGSGNSWRSELYTFDFLVRADATTNGVGKVFVVDRASVETTVENSSPAQKLAKKAPLLQLIFPAGLRP